MKSLVYHEYFYKPLPMYIWLTHTTAIRDLRAADNRGCSSLKAHKGCEACPAQNWSATLEEVGCAYVHPGIWLTPHKVLPVSIEII